MAGTKQSKALVGYGDLLADVKARIWSAQYAALRAVNRELVGLYWEYRPHDRRAARRR